MLIIRLVYVYNDSVRFYTMVSTVVIDSDTHLLLSSGQRCLTFLNSFGYPALTLFLFELQKIAQEVETDMYRTAL